MVTKQIKPPLGSMHFDDVDMEIANRITLELLPGRLVVLDAWQTGDAVTLQAAMQGGAAQMRDRRLKRVQAIIQGQQAMTPKRHDDGFPSLDRTLECSSLGPVGKSLTDWRCFHLATVFGLMP
jgi:hypothetical protein